MTNRKTQTRPLSNQEKGELLRQGRASELVKGGVWYYKNEKGAYMRVVSDLEHLPSDYREFCNNSSKMGFMYVFRQRPNYSVEEWNHVFDEQLINYYKK